MCQQDRTTDSRAIHQGITAEQASRMAVTALASDIEYWARESARDGQVSVDDLTRVLDVVREASRPMPDLLVADALLDLVDPSGTPGPWDHAHAS